MRFKRTNYHPSVRYAVSPRSGVARGCGPPRAALPGGGILDKLYVIIFLSYFEQLLLGYIAYLLIVNHISPHPFPTRQHTSPLTPYTFPHPPHTSFLTSPHTPSHFPHLSPHSFDYVAKLPSNSKSSIKFFTATGNLKSCCGVGNVNFPCMKVWRNYHVAKLLATLIIIAK